MWKVSHTETVSAPAASVWNRWTNVESWPEQDETLASASVDGPFQLGSTLILKPKKSPSTRSTLALVTEDAGFAYVTKIPLAKLQFTHHLEEKDGRTEFTHSVSISGPLFWLYAPLLGKNLERIMIKRMQKIVELIEHKQGA